MLRWAAFVAFTACVIQTLRLAPPFYWDSFNYGWIAIAGSVALASMLVFLPGRYWQRWGPSVLVLVLAGEVVAHRVLFEMTVSAALAEVRPKTMEAGAIAIEPWYKWPRHLVYQPVRVPRPSLSAPYEPVGDLYHYIWTFLGIDPCVPYTRSDTYARWVEEALERRGATASALNYGRLEKSRGRFRRRLRLRPAQAHHQRPHRRCADAPLQRQRALHCREHACRRQLDLSRCLAAGLAGDARRHADPVGRNEDGFKTLEVPPGEHRVELAFRPLVGEGALTALAVLLSLSLVAQLWLALRAGNDWPERTR